MTFSVSDFADAAEDFAALCRSFPATENPQAIKAGLLAAAVGGVDTLQRVLNVTADGIVGPLTKGALDAREVSDLLRALADEAKTPTPEPPSPQSHPDVPQAYAVEYAEHFLLMKLDQNRIPEIDRIARNIAKNAGRYQTVASSIFIPYWPLIGIVHNLESGMDFTTHLHNGDPLTSRTVHDPAGRPAVGHPPFTWEASATDALSDDQHWDSWADWSVPGMAYLLEKYNGFGYRKHGVPSPYLWAGSDIYSAGRFVADHVFDANSVSRQIGGMSILKFLSDAAGA